MQTHTHDIPPLALTCEASWVNTASKANIFGTATVADLLCPEVECGLDAGS